MQSENLSMEDISTLVLKRPGYENIIEQVIIQAEAQPEKQKAFITFLFAVMSVEGDAHVTDLRDAAFTIFAHPKIQPILESNPEFILTTYIQSVRTQNGENDPYSGSIATLLEAGKVISTILRPVKRDLDGIIKAWEIVSDNMPEAEDRKWIYKAVGEIEHPGELYGPRPSTVELDYHDARVEVKTRKGPRPSTVELDNQVAVLVTQGLKHKQIATVLNESLVRISNSEARLRKAGRMEPIKRKPTEIAEFDYHDAQVEAKTRKGPRPSIVERDNQVEALSKQGLSLKEMARRLHVSSGTIDSSRSRLGKAGRVEVKTRKGPRLSKAEFVKLDSQVEALSKQGLKRKEIAETLNVSLRTIDYSRFRLRKAGRMDRWQAEFVKLDKQVEALSKQGLKRKEIAILLGETLVRISNSKARLRKAGRMEPIKRKPTEIAEFDNQVEVFIHQGLSLKEITPLLNVPYWKITDSTRRLHNVGRMEPMKRGRSSNEQP